MTQPTERKHKDMPSSCGSGPDPDKPIDQAVSTDDEEPPFAMSTPDAPPISPPGDENAFEELQRDKSSQSAEEPSDRPKRDRN